MGVIFGYVGDGGGLVPSVQLLRMQAALAYAMPRGTALRGGPGWGMGQAGPADIDSAALDVADGASGPGCVCVADAHVSNRADLAARLGVAGPLPCSTALLIAAYARWGEDLGQHAEGAWTLAAYDPAERALTVIRDPLGLRPVYVASGAGWIAFSSETDALLRLPGVGTTLDPVGLAAAWLDQIGWAEPEATALRDVRAVPAGHVLRQSLDGARRSRRYWSLQPLEPMVFADERDAVQAFRDVFGAAVGGMLEEAASPGLMLSGGIDSGAVLAAASGFIPASAKGLVCISGLTASESWGLVPEMDNIRHLLASQPGHLTFEVPPPARGQGLLDAADAAEVAWGFPHPMHGSALVPGLGYRVAQAAGVDVMLDGIDGDLVTAPSADPIAARLAMGEGRAAWAEAVAASKVNTYLHGQPPSRIVWRALSRAAMPDWGRRLRERAKFGDRMAESPLAPSLLLAGDIRQRLQEAHRRLPLHSSARHAALLAHRLSGSAGSFYHLAARRGIEARHPWAHRPVVEFLQQLPPEWRVRHGWTKYLVRRACEDALGPDVVWHSGKAHVGMALTAQVVSDAAPYLHTLVSRQREAVQAIFHKRVVDRALSYLRAPEAGGDPDNAMQVASLAGWLQRLGGADAGTPSP